MCSRGCRPLAPVVRLIQYSKSWARWVDIAFGETFWSSPPSCRLLESPHRSPPDDPMRYSGFLEFCSSEFGIIFLYADAPDSWEYLESCPELISLPYSLYDIIGILTIVVKKYSRSSTIIREISGNEWAREGFQEMIYISKQLFLPTLPLRIIYVRMSGIFALGFLYTLGVALRPWILWGWNQELVW